jgi:hypothetical protein
MDACLVKEKAAEYVSGSPLLKPAKVAAATKVAAPEVAAPKITPATPVRVVIVALHHIRPIQRRPQSHAAQEPRPRAQHPRANRAHPRAPTVPCKHAAQ